jgi:phosphoglycolate phosphatase-like HAD superfamily hydrolase
MADFLQSTDKPLVLLLEQHGRYKHDFVRSTYQGDVGSGNIIKQIFQEIYLGEELFRSTYNLDAEVYRGKGFILREKVMLDRQLLEDLADGNVLAIATGRPWSEAEYPLSHFRLNHFFSHILTLDDCLVAENRIFKQTGRMVSLSKPNPFMLDAIVKKYPEPFKGYYYVGDMPDDMLAAAKAQANFKGIGMVLSAPDKESLKADLMKAGASFIVDSFAALNDIIL